MVGGRSKYGGGSSLNELFHKELYATKIIAW